LGKAQAFGGLAWPGFPSQLTAMPRSRGRSALAPKPPALPAMGLSARRRPRPAAPCPPPG